MEEEKTYQQEMYCENCGDKFTKSFNKGHGCKGYHECPTCGCNTAKTSGLVKRGWN